MNADAWHISYADPLILGIVFPSKEKDENGQELLRLPAIHPFADLNELDNGRFVAPASGCADFGDLDQSTQRKGKDVFDIADVTFIMKACKEKAKIIIFGKNLGVNNTVLFKDGCQKLSGQASYDIMCPGASDVDVDADVDAVSTGMTQGIVLSRSHYHAVVELPPGVGLASLTLSTTGSSSAPQTFNYSKPDISKVRFGPNLASASEVGTFAAVGGIARAITLEADVHRLFIFGENFGETQTKLNITIKDECSMDPNDAEARLCPNSPLCPGNPNCMLKINEEPCVDARWHAHQLHDWGNKGRPFLSCQPLATTVGYKAVE